MSSTSSAAGFGGKRATAFPVASASPLARIPANDTTGLPVPTGTAVIVGPEMEAQKVLAACSIAGRTVKEAADFLSRGMTGKQACNELLVMRVQESGPEICATVLPGDGANAAAEPKPAKSLAARMKEKFTRKGKG